MLCPVSAVGEVISLPSVKGLLNFDLLPDHADLPHSSST